MIKTKNIILLGAILSASLLKANPTLSKNRADRFAKFQSDSYHQESYLHVFVQKVIKREASFTDVSDLKNRNNILHRTRRNARIWSYLWNASKDNSIARKDFKKALEAKNSQGETPFCCTGPGRILHTEIKASFAKEEQERQRKKHGASAASSQSRRKAKAKANGARASADSSSYLYNEAIRALLSMRTKRIPSKITGGKRKSPDGYHQKDQGTASADEAGASIENYGSSQKERKKKVRFAPDPQDPSKVKTTQRDSCNWHPSIENDLWALRLNKALRYQRHMRYVLGHAHSLTDIIKGLEQIEKPSASR